MKICIKNVHNFFWQKCKLKLKKSFLYFEKKKLRCISLAAFHIVLNLKYNFMVLKTDLSENRA